MSQNVFTGAFAGAANPDVLTLRKPAPAAMAFARGAMTHDPTLFLDFEGNSIFIRSADLSASFNLLASCARATEAYETNWSGRDGDVPGRLVRFEQDTLRVGVYGSTIESSAGVSGIRNMLAEGGTQGQGLDGTGLPTHWGSDNASMILNSGRPFHKGTWRGLELNINATPSAGTAYIWFEEADFFAASSGDERVSQLRLMLKGGSLAGITSIELVTQGTDGTSQTEIHAHDITPDSDFQSRWFPAALANVSTTHSRAGLAITFDGGAVDCQLVVSTPQHHDGTTPNSPEIPQAGNPQALTRAADVITGASTGRDSIGLAGTNDRLGFGDPLGRLVEFLPGVLRSGFEFGALIENSGTNLCLNPGFIGADGATYPEDMNHALPSGGTVSYERTLVDFERFTLPCLDITFGGTPAINATYELRLITPGVMSATENTAYTLSCFMQLLDGALTNMDSLALRTNWRTAANGNLGNQDTLVTPDDQLVRHGESFTPPANTASGTPVLRWVGNGGAVNAKLRLAIPQPELNPRPTSPILPPLGQKGSTTRARDNISLDIGDWFHPKRGTLVLEYYRLPESGVFLSLSDGSLGNRIQIAAISDGRLRAQIDTGSVSRFDQYITPGPADGQRVRVALAFTDTGASFVCTGSDPATASYSASFEVFDRLLVGAAPNGNFAADTFISSITYSQHPEPVAVLLNIVV